MKRFLIYFLALLFAIGSIYALPNKVEKTTSSMSKIKKILKELEIEYFEKENGIIKVPLEVDNKTLMIYISKSQFLEGEEETTYYRFITIVSQIDENINLPAVLFKELNRINSNLDKGVIVYSDGVFIYSSAVWGNNIDANIVLGELYIAFYATFNAREKINDFINE